MPETHLLGLLAFSSFMLLLQFEPGLLFFPDWGPILAKDRVDIGHEQNSHLHPNMRR